MLTHPNWDPKAWDSLDTSSDDAEEIGEDLLERDVPDVQRACSSNSAAKMENKTGPLQTSDPDKLLAPERKLFMKFSMREYTAAELIELDDRFRQKAGESLPEWLLQLRDNGTEGVIVNMTEMSKLALVMR